MDRKHCPRKQKIVLFFSIENGLKVRIKRLTFNKCLPVDGQLHWIQKVNCLFFVLRLKRHLKTGRAGLMGSICRIVSVVF